jgi:hypothetical protein
MRCVSLFLAHCVEIRMSAFAPLLGDKLTSIKGPVAPINA